MLVNLVSSDYTSTIEDTIREHLINLLKVNLSNEDIIDQIDKEYIYKKIKEIQIRNNCNGLSLNTNKSFHKNYDYDFYCAVVFLFSMCLYFYIYELLSAIVSIFLCIFIPTIFYILIFIIFKSICSNNVNKLFNCIKKKNILIEYDCLELLKRHERSLLFSKISKDNNLPDKQLRDSCLCCMQKIVSMLININRSEFICQRENTIKLIDEVDENMTQLCQYDINNSESYNKKLETNSLYGLLKLLSKYEFEFLSFLYFEIQGLLIVKRKEINFLKRLLHILKIFYNIGGIVALYDEELSSLETIYIKFNKLQINKNKIKNEEKEEEEKNESIDIDKHKEIMNNMIRSLIKEIQVANDNEIIGNGILLKLTESIYKFLKGNKKKKRKHRKKNILNAVNKSNNIIENDLSTNNKNNTISKKGEENNDKTIVDSLKLTTKKIEKYNRDEVYKKLEIGKINPLNNQHTYQFNKSLINDLKNQCFFNEKFVYEEIFFKDNSY